MENTNRRILIKSIGTKVIKNIYIENNQGND